MDYVREELLRQKRALEALISSGGSEEKEAETAEEERIAAFAESGAARNRPLRATENDGAGSRLRWERSAERDVRYRAGRIAEENTAALPEVLVGESVSVGEARIGVQEVSRAIQRDARRYDGGFTIY